MTAVGQATPQDGGAKPRFLVVEDEVLVAAFLCSILEDLAVDVVGPALQLGAGLHMAETASIDFAMLDLRLGRGTTSLPIAEALAQRGIPFAFVTASRVEELGRFADRPRVVKPVDERQIAQLVSDAYARLSRPTTPEPEPSGPAPTPPRPAAARRR